MNVRNDENFSMLFRGSYTARCLSALDCSRRHRLAYRIELIEERMHVKSIERHFGCPDISEERLQRLRCVTSDQDA